MCRHDLLDVYVVINCYPSFSSAEIRELKEYLSAALSKAESSDTAVRSAKSECAKLLSELQASTSQLQSLQSDQLSLRNELSSLRAANEALEGEPQAEVYPINNYFDAPFAMFAAKLRSVSQDARDTSQAATAQAYRVGALEAEIHRLTAELQSQTVRTNGLSAGTISCNKCTLCRQ